MDLGNFSISLAVKDLAASRAFYEKLGFRVAQGEASQGWLIMQGPGYTVGLFQGMFDKNILTFNPGWDADAQAAQDVHGRQRDSTATQGSGSRACQRQADETTSGPASCVVCRSGR